MAVSAAVCPNINFLLALVVQNHLCTWRPQETNRIAEAVKTIDRKIVTKRTFIFIVQAISV